MSRRQKNKYYKEENNQQYSKYNHQNPRGNHHIDLQAFENDFFGDMDIRDDFNDPFEGLMGGMFPRIGDIEQRFFGNMKNMLGDGGFDGFNDFDNMGSNGGIRKGVFQMSSTGPGTMISKSYCTKVDYRDGKPHQECYQSQSINQFGKDGHKISEKQEAYKNSRTGVQKAAYQRLLDGKGVKSIKKRNINSGDQEEHNVYKEITDSEYDNWNKNYNDYRNQIHFQDNYKYLDKLNGRKALGRGNQQQRQPMALPQYQANVHRPKH